MDKLRDRQTGWRIIFTWSLNILQQTNSYRTFTVWYIIYGVSTEQCFVLCSNWANIIGLRPRWYQVPITFSLANWGLLQHEGARWVKRPQCRRWLGTHYPCATAASPCTAPQCPALPCTALHCTALSPKPLLLRNKPLKLYFGFSASPSGNRGSAILHCSFRTVLQCTMSRAVLFWPLAQNQIVY
jgi:hypothetical protein